MSKPTLAQQYGQHYADAMEAYVAATLRVREFSDRHPLFIPNPAYPNQDPDGPQFTIVNPVKHTLKRDGDTLSCVECGESAYAPSPPKRPLTPMEASLSPFD